MGKKKGLKRNRDEDEDSDIDVDPELQAEINALAQMRAEQNGETDEAANLEKHAQNKEALLQFADELEVHTRPFIESMVVSQFDLGVHDENDDLEREVCIYIIFYILIYLLTYVFYSRWHFIIIPYLLSLLLKRNILNLVYLLIDQSITFVKVSNLIHICKE